MQRIRIDENTTAVQHERRAIRHPNSWSGGERVCYTQRVDIERHGRIVKSGETRWWHYPNGKLARIDHVALIAEGGDK